MVFGRKIPASPERGSRHFHLGEFKKPHDSHFLFIYWELEKNTDSKLNETRSAPCQPQWTHFIVDFAQADVGSTSTALRIPNQSWFTTFTKS
jgi:hypothetical protein